MAGKTTSKRKKQLEKLSQPRNPFVVAALRKTGAGAHRQSQVSVRQKAKKLIKNLAIESDQD